MKKILGAVLALFVCSAATFAIENSVDANFTVPMLLTSSTTTTTLINTTTTTKSSVNTTAFGFDISDQLMLSKKIGAKASFGMYWPSTYKTKTVITTTGAINNSNTTNGSGNFDAYDSCLDMNAFFGIAIRPYYKNNMAIVVTPGLDLNWYTTKVGDTTNKAFHFGAGADISFNYNINKDFYIDAGCPVIFYFSEKVNGTTNDNYNNNASHLQITPKIGFGYRF